MAPGGARGPAAVIVCAFLCLLGTPAHAAELQQKTVEAFGRYVRATEARMSQELQEGAAFLWVDRLPGPRRRSLYADLRRGEIAYEDLQTHVQGKPIEVPEGMIHHWVGLVFIPQTTLPQAIAVIQDYDNHHNIYKPDIRRSKLLQRDGNDFKVYLQFYKEAIVTVVLNAEFDVRYFHLDATKVHSRSYSTRIAEVENPDQPDEREKPVGQDRGFLWRLYTYWRFQEKDGGVYVQLESIALSRDIPAVFRWLINPIIKRIRRESLSHLLNSTRAAIRNGSDGSLSHPRVSPQPGGEQRANRRKRSHLRDCFVRGAAVLHQRRVAHANPSAPPHTFLWFQPDPRRSAKVGPPARIF